MAAELVSHNRRVEIDAACAFRRVVTIVVVAATSVNGLAVLSAFGGFSLIQSLTIDYSVLFTALATMQIMLTPLLSLVQMLPVFISSFVSVKRLKVYLDCPYTDVSDENSRSSGGEVLAFRHADIGWGEEKPIISDINLSLTSGDVVSISGPASSGKSTILNTVLREARVLSGEMAIGTTKIAYCCQKAWFVPGMSIRDSITLGKEFNEALYNQVVQCCCLDRDFQRLQAGDGAVLDSTGAPLSGGQQKRVALARGLYHEPELLLLDDVFTGLDISTKYQVMERMFGRNGFATQHDTMAVLMVSTESMCISTLRAKTTNQNQMQPFCHATRGLNSFH